MSSYTCISASWTSNSKNEQIELFPDCGVQDHQMEAMEYTFLDICALYDGTYKVFEEDELKGMLLYSKYPLWRAFATRDITPTNEHRSILCDLYNL